ncbi:MAG: substrate-binding domain-containing protein [Lentisphaeria bacterium]|nr:substrate-binding domain-containing protein [Lentisphaeria bacterium]
MIEFKKDLIYEQLKREILGQTLFPGMRLPNEKILARRLNVGQVTLRSALARLEAEKLVQRVRGKGTFVSESTDRRTFLLILPDGAETLETPSRYIAEGLAQAAEKNSVTLERCPVSLLMSFSGAECREMIARNSISGVVLETGHARIDPRVIDRIRSFQLPTVIPHGLPQDSGRSGFLVLRTDERSAFADGFRLLRDYGHRRVAFLRLFLPQEELESIRGFSEAELPEFYRENGLEPDPELLVTINNSMEDISHTVRRWMSMENPPSAVICHSDRIAMKVCLILKELKVKLPDELSIMGYCNYPGSQLMIPALSTVDIKLKQCGEMALEQLLNSRKWFTPGVVPEEIFTPYELIRRESIAFFNGK